MPTAHDELRRQMQREDRAMRPAFGPCLECGKMTYALLPGRDAGFHVYCAICAIGTRTPATLEKER